MAKMGSSLYSNQKSKDETHESLVFCFLIFNKKSNLNLKLCDDCKIEMKIINQFKRCSSCAKIVVDKVIF